MLGSCFTGNPAYSIGAYREALIGRQIQPVGLYLPYRVPGASVGTPKSLCRHVRGHNHGLLKVISDLTTVMIGTGNQARDNLNTSGRRHFASRCPETGTRGAAAFVADTDRPEEIASNVA